MKYIIDMPEDVLKRTVFYREFRDLNDCVTTLKALEKAVPLPEGHGRLGDLDKLERIMYHKAFETDSDMQKWDSGCWIRYKMFENSMEEVPTIIEADTAESEDKE